MARASSTASTRLARAPDGGEVRAMFSRMPRLRRWYTRRHLGSAGLFTVVAPRLPCAAPRLFHVLVRIMAVTPLGLLDAGSVVPTKVPDNENRTGAVPSPHR